MLADAERQSLKGDTMLGLAQSPIERRIRKLQNHLEQENPILLQVVKSFRLLDRVAYRTGMLDHSESFATRVPWWPLIAVLGTFSSGKSSFINTYLGVKLQQTGNQAVDDKFTVICYTNDEVSRTLPGLALDADPRFPFYQMSKSLDQVAAGEGRRIDAYLQLKTSDSERLRGKIIIDSPGFDADAQRTATLRITDHIVTLADLVLVFFDARHPEPGAMQDTLKHLVADTISRPDSNKFMYILNQIDNAAREDNPEEVFAAWQRALAQAGLTAGRFFRIYDPAAAIPIPDTALRERFESKRAEDMAEIDARMQQVEVDRAYRIIGVMENTAKVVRDVLMPRLEEAKQRWCRRVLWLDGIVFGLIGVGLVALSAWLGYWQGFSFEPPWLDALRADPIIVGAIGAGVFAIAAYLHFSMRRIAAQTLVPWLRHNEPNEERREWLLQAFRKNTRLWRSIFWTRPAGWDRWSKRRLERVLGDADRYVQSLNNRFADPTGSVRRGARNGDKPASGVLPSTPKAPAAAVVAPPRDYAESGSEDAQDAGKVRELGGRRS